MTSHICGFIKHNVVFSQKVILMKSEKYHLYLTASELSLLVRSLVDLKNDLLLQGRYTDAVDDLLYKTGNAKPQKLTIKYV